MRVINNLQKVVCAAVWKTSVFIFVLWLSAFGLVQAQSVSPEQLRLLQNLSPEERQALLEAVTQGGAAGTQTPDSLEFPELLEDGELEMGSEEDEEEEEEPRLAANDHVVLEFTLKEDADDIKIKAIEELEGRHFFKLDYLGRLELPFLEPIMLAGLTQEESALRLASEALLKEFDVVLNLLPIEPTGRLALQPFGYQLFEGEPTTFAPATDIPVPTNYVMGPGDTVNIQLFGKENASYSLLVDREGVLSFPGIGPINVAGMQFGDMRQDLMDRVGEQIIGTRAGVTLGELRSIRVFVLGDANQPGSYTVSGLSTITNALFVSGGVLPSGSLRDIQLKRDGALIRRLDLYDLLLRGDTSDDVRLQPGDAIFIPSVSNTVAVAGEVYRPAIYESRGEPTVESVLRMAGGLLPTAHKGALRLERINQNGDKTIKTVNLGKLAGRQTKVLSGDLLSVDPVLDELRDGVTLVGHVHRPGGHQWWPGMRISDLINDVGVLKPRADLQYLLIRREVKPNRAVQLVSADLKAAMASPQSSVDRELQAGDQIRVFDLTPDRSALVEPWLDELREQTTSAEPMPEVNIGGLVRAPGRYPLEAGMRVSDLIRAAGRMREAAFTQSAELTRYLVVGGDHRETELIEVNLAQVLVGNVEKDILLKPYDYLNIKEIPQWRDQERVEIVGEVRFPGIYPIQQGETMSSLLDRVGGLTPLAFAGGSVFLREDLKEREDEQLQLLRRRLETDLAALSLEGSTQARSVGQSILNQIEETEATGRLVIDVNDIIKKGTRSHHDIVMADGDTLLIPKRSQEVTVIGEVQHATSHIFDPDLDRNDYINRSGGFTTHADKRKIYVVRADGGVVGASRSFWFRRGKSQGVQPGDTIVVPLDADRVSPLGFWTSVTQILYNIGIAAAAVSSF
ncbi:MAG: SLBB domain-containing protein [Pseudomonadota bacterium]